MCKNQFSTAHFAFSNTHFVSKCVLNLRIQPALGCTSSLHRASCCRCTWAFGDNLFNYTGIPSCIYTAVYTTTRRKLYTLTYTYVIEIYIYIVIIYTSTTHTLFSFSYHCENFDYFSWFFRIYIHAFMYVERKTKKVLITSNGVGESEAVEKCWYTAQLVRLCVCGDDSISVTDCSSAARRC